MKNTFGSNLTVTLFGESHGAAIGCVIDGLAAGIPLDLADIQYKLDLRKPQGKISTARKEADRFEIISGFFNGHTTGTPLTIIIKNTSRHSKDYEKTKNLLRPSHADYTAFEKYHGFQDYRGGGHFSGRITAPIVAAGAICSQILAAKGIKIACHIAELGGIKESVALIRRAKAQGLDVTCETAPHYLVLTEDDLREDGSFKMNPPLRTQADRQALIEGILDGTVDMIATDHAPHSAQEKARGLAGSAMGIVGLETAFPVLYTHLVRTGVLTLDKLVELMAVNPRKRFGFPLRADDYAVWDLNTEYRIDPAQFCSMGKSTPFAGQTVYGRCVRNVCGGAVVWQDAQV